MEVLFCFLNWAASFSVVDEESGSKMDIHNLATVIAPNILFSNQKVNTGDNSMEESFLAIEAVHSLIECNEEMCEVRLVFPHQATYTVLTYVSHQVPEDVQSILNDSQLFSGSAELTTKEILKRYADIHPTAWKAGDGSGTPTTTFGSSQGSANAANTPNMTTTTTNPVHLNASAGYSGMQYSTTPGITHTPPAGSTMVQPASNPAIVNNNNALRVTEGNSARPVLGVGGGVNQQGSFYAQPGAMVGSREELAPAMNGAGRREPSPARFGEAGG